MSVVVVDRPSAERSRREPRRTHHELQLLRAERSDTARHVTCICLVGGSSHCFKVDDSETDLTYAYASPVIGCRKEC